MANKQLFQSQPGRLPPATNARNEAGGKAYALSPQAALVQYAATGCLNTTFYANADMQLDTVLGLCAVQAQTREDVLNVGGFSDAVFEVLARFAARQLDGEHWVREIEAVEV
ncbi:MAG: hypothetical protein MUC53_15230 [Candidatus Contendobacter sp.]|jgi:hypothetical protein|nr:hypothetical protein [Candidatus Contendobacter sp.]